MNVDKDGIWKDAVSNFLPQLLKRMIPELYNDVDFSQEPTFLDKELQDTIQVSLSEEHRAAKFVDTLVQVPLKSGKDQWILLHVEVQGKGGNDISLRMILYCCLIFAHYHRMPVALAILTDKRPSTETPGTFEFSEYGTKLIYKYNLFEVYNQSDEQLLNSDNPFDSFIYAAKKYSDYMSEDAQKVKLEYLLKITRNLYERGLNEQERTKIIVFVSRLINLEDTKLRKEFYDELKKLEEETDMAEMNWIQEYFYNEARDKVRNEGRNEGLNEGIAIGREEERQSIFAKLIASGMEKNKAAAIIGINS
ncbi:MAG: hypothetical protein II960_07315 [Synergistaceae bacterium]|nr:hypothetical protein [Synergistaceae bacterium]